MVRLPYSAEAQFFEVFSSALASKVAKVRLPLQPVQDKVCPQQRNFQATSDLSASVPTMELVSIESAVLILNIPTNFVDLLSGDSDMEPCRLNASSRNAAAKFKFTPQLWKR